MSLEFSLTYAGTPFCADDGPTIRLPIIQDSDRWQDKDKVAVRQQQPLADMLEDVDRLLSLGYLQDFAMPSSYPGRELGGLARLDPDNREPTPQIRIGDFYYPNSASRWSVFRALATSSMAKAMLSATSQGTSPATFSMMVNPIAPGHSDSDTASYTLSTKLFMLPPRPLAEHGGGLDGLYLITLVDERYWWQYSSASLEVFTTTTWNDLIGQVMELLNVEITPFQISSVYQQPEPDSQFWCNLQSPSLLLDAIALNLGRTVVRNLNGTYSLLTPSESVTIVNNNRGPASKVARLMGGNLFEGKGTKISDLSASKNTVVPNFVTVSFPYYVIGDDPVPHFFNPRYQSPRPTSWNEISYGDVCEFAVPITSGGPLASGLVGVSGYSNTIHTTAKALLATESDFVGTGFTVPLNASGIAALASQVAQDYYGKQVGAALDEVYPGTFAWQPEGFHDIVWTWSVKRRVGSTRVMRGAWNSVVMDMQFSTPPLDGYSANQPGVGGKSVAQTIRDSQEDLDGSLITTLAQTLNKHDFFAAFNQVDYLPTQNRWKGLIDQEIILFEGTQGQTTVAIALRGIDGTLASSHDNGAEVSQDLPNTTYGVNLTTYEKGQFVYPDYATSGGITAVSVVPQIQTVYVADASGTTMNEINTYSGFVQTYLPSQSSGSQFIQLEPCWIVERNGIQVVSGGYYEGLLGGYSPSIQNIPLPVASGDPPMFMEAPATVAPIYLVNDFNQGMQSGQTACSGKIVCSSGTIIFSSGVIINNYNTYNFFKYFTLYPTYLTINNPLNIGNSPKVVLNDPYGGSVTSINGGEVNGRILFLHNNGARVDLGSPAGNILTPLGVPYTLWPDDGCILEYDSVNGSWVFDTPTFGAGGENDDPATYACRQLRFLPPLTYEDKNDGSANVGLACDPLETAFLGLDSVGCNLELTTISCDGEVETDKVPLGINATTTVITSVNFNAALCCISTTCVTMVFVCGLLKSIANATDCTTVGACT